MRSAKLSIQFCAISVGTDRHALGLRVLADQNQIREAWRGMHQVVYLTGAPAAGKSTAAKSLRERIQGLEVFEFGERLTAYLTERRRGLTQEDVRRQSAGVVTPEDVQAVDRQLLRFVAEARTRTHVVIDSHPVTKEAFGFRITPYSLDDFARLAPTQIWVLYADPETTAARIGRDRAATPEASICQ